MITFRGIISLDYEFDLDHKFISLHNRVNKALQYTMQFKLLDKIGMYGRLQHKTEKSFF